MKIYIDPDELKQNSLLPAISNSISCPGLEALTGCDFIVSPFPLPISENTLKAHINAGAIFVQRKSGYDFIGDFEQTYREIARIQTCKIPMQQAFLLAIGNYYPDSDGLLRIKGKHPLKKNKTITYDTFLALEAGYRSSVVQIAEYCYSGVQIAKLNDESEIETWINAQIREHKRIKSRNNKKVLYPPKSPKITETDPGILNLFQDIIEVSPTDIRSVLSCGIPGLGQKKIDTINEYAIKNNYNNLGIYFLKILTDEDKNGKAIHNIAGIGKKFRKTCRECFDLEPGQNLSIINLFDNETSDYNRGWKMALDVFENKLRSGKEPNLAFEETKNQEWEFYE